MNDAGNSGGRAAFTVKEFLLSFGIGRNLFYHEVKAGRLKIKKAGRRTLVLAGDARAWADALPEGNPDQAD